MKRKSAAAAPGKSLFGEANATTKVQSATLCFSLSRAKRMIVGQRIHQAKWGKVKNTMQLTHRVARLMKTKGLGLVKGGNFPGGAPAAR